MKSDETLISKLIEETCIEEKSGEIPKDALPFSPATSEDLANYFDRRLNQVEFLSLKKYITQQNLKSINLMFNMTTKCFRLKISEYILDFPSNWSLFNELGHRAYVHATREDDTDYLCDILSEVVGGCEALVLVKDEEECRLITFNDLLFKEHLEWFKQYFEKKIEIDNLKIAA